MSEKFLFISVLYDYYGCLLKENQATVIDLYYNQDFSLSEIAEDLNMSRAGVHDTLKRAEKNLLEFEEKLALHSRFQDIYGAAEKIIDIINNVNIADNAEIKDNEVFYNHFANDINNIKKGLISIKYEAEKILNEG